MPWGSHQSLRNDAVERLSQRVQVRHYRRALAVAAESKANTSTVIVVVKLNKETNEQEVQAVNRELVDQKACSWQRVLLSW